MVLTTALEGRLFDGRDPSYPCLSTLLDCLFMPHLSIRIDEEGLVFERISDEQVIGTKRK